MPVIEILVVGLVVTALAALAAFSSYGRFARRAEARPSHALPVCDDATPLDRAIAPLLHEKDGRSGLLLLAENLQAFEMRVLAARTAGRSLDLQYYYWLEDLTGDLLAREVVAAADRGVRVRLLIDDINTRGNDSAYLRLDSHRNIEVRLFNPSRNRSSGLRRGLELALRAFRTTRRMHNKAWIADGRLAIVGGRNIGDAYFDASHAMNFHDMDLLFVGAALPATQTIFDDFWNSAAAIPINALSRPIARRLRHKPVGPSVPPRPEVADLYRQRLVAMKAPAELAALVGRLDWVSDVEVVSDHPEKAMAIAGASRLATTIYRTIAAARSELSIVSPYFIPGERGVAALRRLTARGAKVQVLTNSLAATDVIAVHGAYASYRKSLLRSGISLFELRPIALREGASLFGSRGASLHAKAFTIDRRTGFIGSFNFDPRSASLNTEMGVFFSDPGLVDQVRAVILRQTAAANAWQLSVADDRIVWSGDPEASQPNHAEPDASPGRRLAAFAIRLLPIESQL
ncbi:phospholipase D family protein [Bosea sp. PAMC 26642]|uniref:phospholipase D family protein n=1 Tax=Bosea sp. (strain PAMC 26642) TaxID=1792307 RepID=UPI00076FEC2D|nr:phospholipase D family protein [Bosea sp. PAMC 26642]AMJ61788.1 cardiolipin synthase [Bosea sp. PAMC 26642]